MPLEERNQRNYYEDAMPARAARPMLQGHREADVAVVGGGIAGCSVALHLAERGYRVALMEAERIGFGGSGRSGGQLLAGYACGQRKLERLVGAAHARRMWDVSVAGLSLVRDVVARHAIDCELSWGHLHAAVKQRQMDAIRVEHAELVDGLGYRSVRVLERDEVAARVATDRYCGCMTPTAVIASR
jgi:gamma-glutamylputrescine oxidase